MAGNIYTWSTTAATNASADADINFAEGQLPGTLNDSCRAEMAGVAGFVKDNNATISTTGSANAYAATSSNTIAALATGLRFRVKANFTNTTACTLNLTPQGGVAFGAKAIKIVSPGGESDPLGGMITINGIYDFNYDAAANAAAGAWILLNPSPPGDYMETVVNVGSGASLSNNVAANAGTLVSIPPGDWDISIQAYYDTTGTTATVIRSTLSSVSATENLTTGRYAWANISIASGTTSLYVVPYRLVLTSATTVYHTAYSLFSAGAVTAYGRVAARRMR